MVDDVLRHPPRVIEPLTIRVSTDRGIPAMLIGCKRGGTGGIPSSKRRMARLLTPCFARAARSWASDPLAGPPADGTQDRTGLLFFDEDGSFRRADATARDLLRDPDRGPPVRGISEHLARELGARPAQVLVAHATTRAVRIRVTAVRTKGVQAPCAVAVSLQNREDRIPLRPDVRRNHGLTPRQMEIGLLMARRLSHKEIARKLGIRPNTTRRHERAVLTRLGVRSRHQVLAALTRLDTRETNHDPPS